MRSDERSARRVTEEGHLRLCSNGGRRYRLALGGELWVRETRTHRDLWLLTGRTAGPHPMDEWAQGDAFCDYRARKDDYRGLRETTVSEQGFISTPPLGYDKKSGEIRVAFVGEPVTAADGIHVRAFNGEL